MLRQLEPWCELKDKVVLVTGASSGIGRELCLDLGKAGCKIITAARRVDRLKSLCSEINSSSSTVIQTVAIELDVSSDAATIQNSIKEAWEIFGRIDALINNAGIRGNVKSSLDLSEDEWDSVFRTNLTGSWLVSKYVCVLMRDNNRGGSVINISSMAGIRGITPGGIAYTCSKVGVDTMSKMMAIELGVHKIRVNSIAPGLFKSEITQDLMKKKWLKNVTDRVVPLKVQGTVDPALTSLVRYLIHDSSHYISGNTYIVDSGITLPGFCYKEEIARGRYCSPSTRYPCQPGKNYYGRGPIQITWNYNNGAAGRYLGLPLLTDPDMVARSPEVAFKCAMWFWNKNVRSVLDQGFGATIRKINGGECNGRRPAAVQSRVDRYLEFCKILESVPEQI